MLSITTLLQNKIASAQATLLLPAGIIKLEHPAGLSFGDYASNIAMVLAKRAQKNPFEIATMIADEINKDLGSEIEKVEAIKPGFINFHLSKKFFTNNADEIERQNEDFGKSQLLGGKKILIEYTDPNPFKEFHIGHLMANAIGESISRIFEFTGAEVVRANYQGDVGLHVAKAIHGMQLTKGRPTETASLSDKSSWLGTAYVAGAYAYSTNIETKQQIDSLNKIIYERSDKEINELYDWGRGVSLSHFEEIYVKLGTKFNLYFFESDSFSKGLSLVKNNTGSVFKESNGAIIFPGENVGLHTRVFINSGGLPTYEAKDLGLLLLKKESGNFDLSISITASEQTEYFKVMLAAAKEIAEVKDIASKTTHISHGMMRFIQGKMSSRLGNVITGESLIKSTEDLAMEKINNRGLDETLKKEITEAVAISAIKYTILRQSPGKDIIFDPEKSISFEGDSGPYLQYSYTRALSVLEKARNEGIHLGKGQDTTVYELEKFLYRFPEVVALSYSELAPSYIASYLIELASLFNSFYAQNKIIDKDNRESGYRLTLTSNFATVIKNGLYLLGIKTLERM